MLREIFDNGLTLRCDKWESYFDVYEHHFNKFVGKNPVIVEVGVAGGGSLEMWRKYFGESASIYGIDLQPQVERVEGVTLIQGDQNNPKFWDGFLAEVPQIDIFIDDGSHINSHQILTFMKVWPKLSVDGVYLCEDTHTSYWKDYEGGLLAKNTFIEFSKQIVDILHIDYITEATPQKEFLKLTKDIKSVNFYDSQVVFTKGKKFNNRIIKNDTV